MVFKLVICDNCMMWEIRENSTELNQVCVKCRTIQDLLQQHPTKSLGPLDSYINTDRLATFQADNGKYWCSVPHSSGKNNIEAESPIIEEWCKFKVLYASEGKILLQDKQGMYLSRINWGGVGGIDSIMASKAEPDIFCEFEVFLDSGKVILRADNGKFLSRVARGFNKMNIEAAKTAPDEFCSFAISSGEPTGPTLVR
ncbi:UNVERIFIED_CONTAM: hypothetical protein FKN15_010355 [Acipenser sinensis]